MVHWLPFLAQEEVIFVLSFARCNYPWISKEHCWTIDGEWRFNITNTSKWVKWCAASACAAEEAPQSSNSGWTGQFWLRGEVLWGPVGPHFTNLDSRFGMLTLSDLVCCHVASVVPLSLLIFQTVKLGLKFICLAGNKRLDYLLLLSKDQYHTHTFEILI